MHIRQFRRLQTGREANAKVFHGKHGGYDFRIVGTLLNDGWKMQICILSGMERVAEYRHIEAYDNADALRIAGLVIAHEMIGRLPPRE